MAKIKKAKVQEQKSVRLSKKLYSKKAISAAVDEYSAVSSITIAENEKEYIIVLKADDKNKKNIDMTDNDIDIIKGEFCNYVLGLMKDSAFV